jgi:hypothetical protein
MGTTCVRRGVAPSVALGSVPPEPVELLEELRTVALADPGAVAGYAPARVAAVLAGEGPAELTCLGIRPDALRVAAHSYRREIWLWVMGERRWGPTAESILGRAARRTPAA